MVSARGTSQTRSVSFSGVDGSGKSTQIERLRDRLQERGFQVQIVRFWDDIARLKKIREGMGHKVFKGDKGIGSPEAPINRRDKNVRGWPMTCFRYCLYLIDAISLRLVFRELLSSHADVVIFDRYTYDELANLDLTNWVTRTYARLIMRFIPRPDISFVLDADPEAARARKPEYPVDFIHINRRAYLELNRMFGRFSVVSPTGIESAHRVVLSKISELIDDLKAQGRGDFHVSPGHSLQEDSQHDPALS